MSTSATAPLKCATGPQIKTLIAIGKRRRLSVDDLRGLASELTGQASLRSLSVGQAARLIDRLQLDDHRGGYEPAPPDRAARGAIKLASERQRTYIATLCERLGWDVGKAAGWLKRRHGIDDLAGGTFTSKAASASIVQLEHALRKADDGPSNGVQSELETVSTAVQSGIDGG